MAVHQILTHGHANTTLLAGMSHPNLAGAAGILASYQTRQVAAAAGAPQHMCHVVHHGLRRPHPQHSPSTRAGPDRPPCNLSTSSIDVQTSSVELSRARSISVDLGRAQSSSSSTAPELRPDALEIEASSGGSAHLGLGLGLGSGMGFGFGLGSG